MLYPFAWVDTFIYIMRAKIVVIVSIHSRVCVEMKVKMIVCICIFIIFCFRFFFILSRDLVSLRGMGHIIVYREESRLIHNAAPFSWQINLVSCLYTFTLNPCAPTFRDIRCKRFTYMKEIQKCRVAY